jgi:hypothetical protein
MRSMRSDEGVHGCGRVSPHFEKAVTAPTIRSSQIMRRRHRNGAGPFHLLELIGVDKAFATSAGFCRRGAGSRRGFCLTKSQ